jgi:hypothetical protein
MRDMARVLHDMPFYLWDLAEPGCNGQFRNLVVPTADEKCFHIDFVCRLGAIPVLQRTCSVELRWTIPAEYQLCHMQNLAMAKVERGQKKRQYEHRPIHCRFLLQVFHRHQELFGPRIQPTHRTRHTRACTSHYRNPSFSDIHQYHSAHFPVTS